MTLKFLLRAFGHAVLFGSFAGGVPPMVVTGPIAISMISLSLSGAAYLAVLPLMVAFAFVLPLSFIVGLPLHFALRRLGAAYSPVLIILAAGIGFMAPWVLAYLFQNTMSIGFCLLGAFSGGATAWKWCGILEQEV